MQIIDIVILVLLLLALVKGIKDGLIRQIGGIAGVFIGIFLAGRFSALVSEWLHQWVNASESVVKALAFALIIIGTLLLMGLIGKILENVISVATLGWVNRLLGAVLSVITTVLILGSLLSLVEYVNETWFTIISKETMESSQTIGIIKDISETIFPYLKQLFKA